MMRILPVAALAAAAYVIMAAGCAVQTEQPDVSNGTDGMDFRLYDLEGESVVLSELLGEGNKVILAFWTTWCPGCVQAVPAMRKFYSEHGDEVSLVSINIREGESAVKRFADEKEIGFRIAMDRDGSVARKFNVVGVPTYIVLEPDGEKLYQGHDFGSAVREAGF